MTQKELAERIGVTEAVVSRYISGDREPKPEMLANIATALHTTSDFLLGIETEEYSHSRIRRMIARNASNMTEQEKQNTGHFMGKHIWRPRKRGTLISAAEQKHSLNRK